MNAPLSTVALLQQDCPQISRDLAEKYRALGYWQEETFDTSLEWLCQQYGDDIALIEGGVRLSYTALSQRIECIANNLKQNGLQAGDCVVLQLDNSVVFVEIVFALARLGVVPVLALPTHRHLEISNFCAFTQAKAYFIQDQCNGYDYRGLARELQSELSHLTHIFVKGEAQEFHDVNDLYERRKESTLNLESPQTFTADPQSVVCFQISGGTTGIPKLIPRRHNEYLYNMRTCAKKSGINRHTVYLCVLPIAHNFPFACPGIMGTLLSGGTTVLSQDARPESCLSLIGLHQITLTSLVPPLAILWLQIWHELKQTAPLLLDSLQVLQVGGAKLSYEIAKRIEPELGCQLQQVFGMAEGLICLTELDEKSDLVYFTQGKPMSSGDEVRVVDDNDEEVARGEVGQLLTRGPYTIAGYYRMAVHNQKVFTEDGFYRTGDMVKQTPEGYLNVVGRDKDLINRGGEKIAPEEVENILLSHSNILDASVLGLPDELYGECIHAFIIVKEGKLKKPVLVRFLQEKGLADFKVPDRMHFVASFPATGIGKVSKKQLREDIRQAYQEQTNLAKSVETSL